MMRLPDAVATSPARKFPGVGLVGEIGRPAGDVAGGDMGTAVIRPASGSSRSKPPEPNIRTLPSLPTAIESGREVRPYSFTVTCAFRLITLMVLDPKLAA